MNKHKNIFWYDITFKSIIDKRNAPTIGNIELTTQVRQQTTHDIILDNPLPHKVTFQGQCTHPDILLPPEQVSVPASSQVKNIDLFKLNLEFYLGYI